MGNNEEIAVRNGGISEEQIITWKAKNRRLYEISIEDGNVTHVGYAKAPDMETMAAVNKLSKTDEVKSADTLFKNCWLGGDPEIQDDTLLKMEAITQLSKIFGACKGRIKNL